MQVYASAMGQYDNVGDTVLRRGFLDALRQAGQLNVFVGNRDDDHLSGLGLSPDDIIHRDSAAWRRRLSQALLRERSLYAFDTGETEVQRAFALRYLRLAPLLLVSRLRGGRAAHVGLGVRESTPWRIPISLILRLADVVSWRDHLSRTIMGVGTVTPDWAFALGSPVELLRAAPTDAGRTLLAVSLRAGLSHSPREKPTDEWVATIGRLAALHGLEPVIVAQIERDGPLALEMAEKLGCDSVVWQGPNHALQEERLRATYRRSRAIISDRLHGLIIAATEGAVPIALSASAADKATRTLAGVGITATSIDHRLGSYDDAAAIVTDSLNRHSAIMEKVITARADLAALTGRIVKLGARKGSA